MRSSYRAEDVEILLKDITGLVKPLPTGERERLIQSGRHYSEMLPVEYVPSPKYMEVYEESLKTCAGDNARAVERLAEKILKTRGKGAVLVSLARAGIPVGILLKRCLWAQYGAVVPHYAVSIIRGRGIDHNAMRYLLERYEPEQLLFVDGWIGKGAILAELQKAAAQYPGVSPELAVLADPANVTDLCGTHEDILIPSSCLNSTVSGLISRTFLREDIIGPEDFHGAVYYGELKASDLSYAFIEAIERHFGEKGAEEKEAAEALPQREKTEAPDGYGVDEVRRIAEHFGIEDINFVKPGIGETTRVLLRRVPWAVLIDEASGNCPELRHIVRLAGEKQVPVRYYPLRNYKCCGIIRKIADA